MLANLLYSGAAYRKSGDSPSLPRLFEDVISS